MAIPAAHGAALEAARWSHGRVALDCVAHQKPALTAGPSQHGLRRHPRNGQRKGRVRGNWADAYRRTLPVAGQLPLAVPLAFYHSWHFQRKLPSRPLGPQCNSWTTPAIFTFDKHAWHGRGELAQHAATVAPTVRVELHVAHSRPRQRTL